MENVSSQKLVEIQ